MTSSFLTHGEDKEAVAKPLADALISKGAEVWLDKYEMTVGDSLRQSIVDGLAHSRYGIIILSETYFKKFWTCKELTDFLQNKNTGKRSSFLFGTIYRKIRLRNTARS